MEKVALVTGSARGIGRGIAEALAAANYSVVINGIGDSSAGEESVRSCLEKGAPRAIYCKADISDPQDRSTLLSTIQSHFGRIDLLVNNAGVAPAVRMDLLEATEESFDRVITINLKGPYFLTQMIGSWMIELRKKDPSMSSVIINVSSISAYTSSPMRGEYCISKAGISMMTQLFADRLANDGINVYEIRPGIIMTDMTSGVKEKYDTLISEGLTPIKRWGLPEDIGKAVVAFANGSFPFSTGEVVNVDGGFHMRRL